MPNDTVVFFLPTGAGFHPVSSLLLIYELKTIQTNNIQQLTDGFGVNA